MVGEMFFLSAFISSLVSAHGILQKHVFSFRFSWVALFFSLTCSLVGAGGVFHEHVPGHLFGTRRSPSDHFQRDLLRTGVHLAIGEEIKNKRRQFAHQFVPADRLEADIGSLCVLLKEKEEL